jgi:hypothetical protein
MYIEYMNKYCDYEKYDVDIRRIYKFWFPLNVRKVVFGKPYICTRWYRKVPGLLLV